MNNVKLSGESDTSHNNMTSEYKVSRLLWENLESVLLAQSKRYIAELAKRLNVSERELIKKVMPTSDSMKVILQDSQVESNQCKAYVQHDSLTVFCKKPVAYHSEFCAIHRNKRMTVVGGTNPTVIKRVKSINTLKPLWVIKKSLMYSNGSMAGKINDAEQKIKVFVLE